MKNREISGLLIGLTMVGDLKGVTFAYAVARNIKKLNSEMESIRKARGDKYNEYDDKRIELARSMSKKDGDGNPIMIGSNFTIPDVKEFERKLEKLKEKYKKEIDEYEEFLDKDSDIELHKIEMDDVPTDISAEQMTGIFDIIVDPDSSEDTPVKKKKKRGRGEKD
jgi:hypothetical protein